MISLAVNSVLFDAFDFATAARHIAAAGYDGIEIAAIPGMCEHLEVERWRQQAADVRAILAETGLRPVSMETADRGDDRYLRAFEACAELGIPVVAVGSGGTSGDPDNLRERIARLAELAEAAAGFGITVCCKAHVGSAVYDTPSTLAAMDAIASPGFGINMDPSHIHRAGEVPKEALQQVVSRVRHSHIRDCKGRQQGPGAPPVQACGRGDIDLFGYCKVLADAGYQGAASLEVIGAVKAGLSRAEPGGGGDHCRGELRLPECLPEAARGALALHRGSEPERPGRTSPGCHRRTEPRHQAVHAHSAAAGA